MSFWTDNTLKEPLRQNRWYILFGTPDLDSYRFALKECSKPEYTIDTTAHLLINNTFNYPKNVIWKPITVKMISAIGKSEKVEPRTFEKERFPASDLNNSQDKTVRSSQKFSASFIFEDKIITSFSSNLFIFSLSNAINNLLYSSGYKNNASGNTIAKNSSPLNIELIQVDSNGNRIENWKLANSFITNVNYGTLSYASDEFVDVSFTIAYDHASLDITSPSKFEENDVSFGYETPNEIERRKSSTNTTRIKDLFGYEGTQGQVVGSPGLPWQPSPDDSET